DPVETLQEEAICAICLDYFADPVSIGCGHNFCRGCISRLWARGPAAFTCPQCRKSFSQRSFRPNLQLANMVHIIRQLHPGPGTAPGPAPGPAGTEPAPGGPPELCPKHREPLKLFCEQDLAPICVVCREARGHKQHSVLPLDEA
ncbi:TRI27 protein, partial [Pheucticus melanocephalus]|nr:TRI27 protein [Pheucticus melanocephalus]